MGTLANYPFLKPCFWSYRLSDLEIKKHQTLIIKQILNHGHQAATDWLRATYSEKEIKDVLINSARSEWSPKSLNLWSLIYQAEPAREQRLVEVT